MYDYISDYCSSEYFLFLDEHAKEHAEELLGYFSKKAGDALSYETIDAIILEMAHLDLPLQARQKIPLLLDGYITYLHNSGKVPGILHYAQYIAGKAADFENNFREDGTVRGETFTKKYTDVGRNDPCPCGSNKKFKKCCMRLLQ
ncbi:MAG: SEC-C metal-binding domain-containing protein [archaeon]